ncbi:hypothetical protein [Streptomyces litchfieldiae]|uniref:Methyltransferase n=1 Tax=Streptomyces litchfieldiae TaxID=3075543 RepID=A0ABU2MQH2_9ACTN|nr:hypothetical protein [Streptomyces sp. DSM 44938]MDT0343795.1 hypothetical protein [Streptomyces sp. DSM 44938]
MSWLGATVYLDRAAIVRTLAEVSRLAPGAELVLDHLLPARLRDPAGRAHADLVGPLAAGAGEPWLTFLGPGAMSALLRRGGFRTLEHATQFDAVDPALWQDRVDPLRPVTLAAFIRARALPRAADQ